MYLLVLFLLQLSFQDNSFAQQKKKIIDSQHNTYKEDLPTIVFVCEYCSLKKEKISLEVNFTHISEIDRFKYVFSSEWNQDSQLILKKQQDTEYQISGTKSWPPKVPHSLSPLKNKKGLLVFRNYQSIAEKHQPYFENYVLFYHDHVYIAEKVSEIQNSLNTSDPNLNKRDGIRFFITKEISGESIKDLEKVIKNFTADKNSIIIPYQVTSEGVRYKSDIDVNQKMRTIKQINQFVPNLSAQAPKGTTDIIEITRVK
ncbi:hypothetical protein QEJ31_05550 [Pigmentibacter sp. JX0631]|uniref:hypothetical protein n=1 Tax=Pigmentibacter sp. JX0631 TaxID=2976982 RepID=UPI002468B6EE|nr:hypothetical protein [Pigmentibacter sp. JX0631]WGL61058.1 hypothetical protein QEJ31_05550 [Pigmentibacter sp. JX0631]